MAVVCTGPVLPPGQPSAPAPDGIGLSRRAFFERWKPGAALFSGALDPALAACSARRGIPAIWIDASPEPGRRRFSLRRVQPQPLPDNIRAILTGPGAAVERLRHNQDIAPKLEPIGFLSVVGNPPPCATAARDAMQTCLRSRQLWLASATRPGEIAYLASAHRLALMHTHRLLLVVDVQPAEGSAIARELNAGGWRVALRSAGEDPTEEVQIVVADDPDERGLWYRMAGVTLPGGSLAGPGPVRHPYEAASLGSAILAGPFGGEHATAIDRLAARGAARNADNPGAIADALRIMLAPEEQARMAAAGLDVATEGSVVLDRVVGLIDGLMSPQQVR